jgi:hypothetical protein
MVIDLNVASHNNALSPQEHQAAIESAFAVETNEIKALIGDDGFEQLNAHGRIEAQKFVDSAIHAEFNAAGMPLLPDQVTALAKAEIESNSLSGKALTDSLTGRLTQSFTPAQLQILTSYLGDRDEYDQFLVSHKELTSGH